MKERKRGRIINVASAHALVASPFKSAYVSAKHGIAGLTKTVALELAEDNITVNAICPGYVLTPLVEKQIPDTAKARGISEEAVVRDVLLAAQPTKRFVTVEEVAALAVFLAGDSAGVDHRRHHPDRRRLDRPLNLSGSRIRLTVERTPRRLQCVSKTSSNCLPCRWPVRAIPRARTASSTANT